MTEPANKRGWGWPGAPNSAEDRRYRANHIIALEVQGVKLYVRQEVARLFKGFIDELCSLKGRNGRLYRLDVNADDWGYANRDVRGRPGVKSNHAWGLAVDLNSATNPMTEDGRTHTDLPSNVSSLASKWGLRWGGDYTGSRRDPMHFEFIGTPTDASRLIKKLFPPTSGGQTDPGAGDLDVDEATLRRIVGEVVDQRIRLVLIGDVRGEVGDQHPNNLEQVRKDIADLKDAIT